MFLKRPSIGNSNHDEEEDERFTNANFSPVVDDASFSPDENKDDEDDKTEEDDESKGEKEQILHVPIIEFISDCQYTRTLF